MIHLDLKKFRNFNKEGIRYSTNGSQSKSAKKGAGSRCLHVAVDDHSRYASVSIFDDETAESVTRDLIDTYNYYASQGIVLKRVLTDNGSGYKSKKFADACGTLNLKHIFTQPYTLQTNGKVERFIQTLLREWAYVRTYKSSERRKMFLKPFLHMYNWHRPHSGTDGKLPIRRLYKGNYNLPAYHNPNGPYSLYPPYWINCSFFMCDFQQYISQRPLGLDRKFLCRMPTQFETVAMVYLEYRQNDWQKIGFWH